MSLEKPDNHFLKEIYDVQEKRLQAIVEEIVEIEEYSEVIFFFGSVVCG
jgi:hypothetical protein